jgi:Tfp pilus assembly protein PilN
VLDFLHPAGRPSRLSPWLLLAGGLAALAALSVEREVAQAIKGREARVEEVRSLTRRSLPALRGADADTPALREQIKKANGVLAQLNVPWSALFAAIESAQAPDVALLAVQPDPRGNTVALAGQARSLEALWEYMDRLQRTDRLRDVVLVSHEIKAEEPGRPVAFVLSARWVAA